jgi:UDP-GlcNAc:undecaprenyl-phosphate/decaprenyl-phosphate GlcNAc-1-phosphate transferase
VGVLVAFAVAVVCTPLARRLALALGVLDAPGPLKIHREPVPYLGGVAVFVALATVIAPTHLSYLLPLGLAAALGIADDIRSVPPVVRLLSQVTIGCIAGAIAPAPGRFGLLITAGLVVVLVNAVNLIDGMDALASCVVGVSALGFAAVGGDARILAFAVCGALAGFLLFNRPPAQIYLGDGGSYLLGTAIAMLSASALHTDYSAVWIALPFLVGLPLADAAIAILRRYLAKRPLMLGDRSHVYDQLADRGWSVPRVVLVCASVQLLATVTGLLLLQLGVVAATAGALAVAVAAAIFVWRAGLLTPKAVA